MKPCPNCKSRATKVVHMSAPEKPIECQICGHRYNEHDPSLNLVPVAESVALVFVPAKAGE